MDYIEIGHTKKTYGIAGEVRVRIYDAYIDSLEQLGFVFIKMEGIQVPWEIESARELAGLCFKFATIDTPEAAHVLTGKPIFAARKDLVGDFSIDHANPDLKFADLREFSVFLQGQENHCIGTITEVEEYPNQEMANIRLLSGETRLIPIVEAFLRSINWQKREVVFELPDGLLDLE